jgi:hypothetical protein
MLASDDPQVTVLVRIWVELSEYVPVAMNCSVPATGILGPVGVIAIDTSVAGVTVRVTGGDVMPPRAAETVVVPVAAELAVPALPEALLIVATAGVAEPQVT